MLSSIVLYWYVELERRLLVLRHAFVDEIGLIRSPLLRGYILQLLLTSFHIPPFINFFAPSKYLSPEFQLFTFIRLFHIMKFMREQHFMRYNRIRGVKKSLLMTHKL